MQRVIDRVDLDAVVDSVDLDAAVARVDLNAAADRIDVDRVVARVDVDAIAASLDIEAIVAESTKGVFGRFIDLLRRQVVGIDEISMRTVNRLLRRDYDSLPVGPPLAVDVEPPPAAPHTMSGRYAGPVSRIGALGLDLFLISSTFTLLIAGVAYLLDVLFGSSIDLTESGSWIVGVALLFYGFSYFWISQALTGRTISQALFGLKVMRSDGSTARPRRRSDPYRRAALQFCALRPRGTDGARRSPSSSPAGRRSRIIGGLRLGRSTRRTPGAAHQVSRPQDDHALTPKFSSRCALSAHREENFGGWWGAVSNPDRVGRLSGWQRSVTCSPPPSPRSVRSTQRALRHKSPPVRFVLDVREPDEYEEGAIPGAIHIPRGHLEAQIENRITDKNAPVVVYCAGGVRSAFAAVTLAQLGFTDVESMEGGFGRWKDEGRPWKQPASLTPEQNNRYKRHLLLPEVGTAGQVKLLDAKVLMLGAGGLGSPAALYLAAAGVGTIGIVDMDEVDSSNLQRQILHNIDRIGDRKVDSAKKTLTMLNPDVDVVTYDTRLDASNIIDIISGYDVIVDGADNFPSRYLLNDASVKLGIPVVHGSIFRFEGMVSVFHPTEGPTYRDMVPEPPPAELAPSCAEAGVLGVLPGIIGSIQALETIKVILGLGDSLIGRILTVDTMDMEFRVFNLKPDPANEVTWANRDRIEIKELDGLCAPGLTH